MTEEKAFEPGNTTAQRALTQVTPRRSRHF